MLQTLQMYCSSPLAHKSGKTLSLQCMHSLPFSSHCPYLLAPEKLNKDQRRRIEQAISPS